MPLAHLVIAFVLGCRSEQSRSDEKSDAAVGSNSAVPPKQLYLPDAAEEPPPSGRSQLRGAVRAGTGRCPSEMVDIRGQFCIDRYENVFVDASQRRRLSAFFSPTPGQTKSTFEFWRAKWQSSGSTLARSTPIPEPPPWQLGEDFDVVALSLPSELPNAYVSGVLAARACENAGKRLCSADEWSLACRGQAQRKFPYGDSYEHGRCNVHRSTHPARALHHDASRNHLDPRLNLVVAEDGPLLVPTGSSRSCASRWGDDAVYDMVGNLDEWVAEPEGEFRGGFYARATKEGCEARVTTHPLSYFDYSLGSRCCL